MAKVKVDPDVQKLIDEYNSAYNILCRSGEFLYGARLSAAKTIANVEDLVNSIANHPKTFDTNIEAMKLLSLTKKNLLAHKNLQSKNMRMRKKERLVQPLVLAQAAL